MSDETFILKEEHLKLLRKAYVRWDDCETGAPCIDPKRPYGNSSVRSDVAKILGLEGDSCPHCGESLEDGEESLEDGEEGLLTWHYQTEHALAILVLRAGKASPPGKYVRRGGPFGQWELMEETR